MRRNHFLAPLLGATALSISLIGGYGHGLSQAHATSITQSTATPPSGHWVVLAPRSILRRVPSPDMLPIDESGCPPNVAYSGSESEWNCYAVPQDGSGHDVWIREGYANSYNDNGFGYNHFNEKHNLELGPVEDVIARSAYGIQQDVNGRYLYGEYYQDPEGGIDQYVNVIEDRTTAPVSDGQEVGVVTAYCEDADGNEEDTCPDWVNQTV